MAINGGESLHFFPSQLPSISQSFSTFVLGEKDFLGQAGDGTQVASMLDGGYGETMQIAQSIIG